MEDAFLLGAFAPLGGRMRPPLHFGFVWLFRHFLLLRRPFSNLNFLVEDAFLLGRTNLSPVVFRQEIDCATADCEGKMPSRQPAGRRRYHLLWPNFSESFSACLLPGIVPCLTRSF